MSALYLLIAHPFHRGRDGRCVFPVRHGDHFVPCGKMATLHHATASVETLREGHG